MRSPFFTGFTTFAPWASPRGMALALRASAWVMAQAR